MIGFVGSVFSPYYRTARKAGDTDPENHCAINVALYGRNRRWAMTEVGKRFISRDVSTFTVSSSSMRWDGDKLRISINEHCSPIPSALHGEITITPLSQGSAPVVLSEHGHHIWQPVCPEARVDVRFNTPGMAWSGTGYHDSNWGDEPLEKAFRYWTWLRAKTKTGTRVIYDAELRDGSRNVFAQNFSQGTVTACEVPPSHRLPKAFWRMSRPVRSEVVPKLIVTLEDAPFYTRNHIELVLDGAVCEAVHESLSLDRFIHPVTQLMLPFKMRRRR